MLVFFPLNSFLFFHESLAGGKQVLADVSTQTISMQDTLQAKESVKIEEPKKPKAQAVDDPKYHPVRKEGAQNLVVPGAHSSVIIDADSGTILHYSEGREKRQIASLTKLMTAVLVIEKVKNLDEIVTIDEEAIMIEGTRVGCPRTGYCTSERLKVGEKITVRKLLQAVLMNSANDAAVALAKHLAGSQSKFADMMNEKAKELGLFDSNFCTPSGLEIEGRESECYSSAYDIARVAAYSLRYDNIWDNYKNPPEEMTIVSEDGKIKHEVLNTVSNIGKIPNAIGGKTGFTPLAGYSLLVSAADPIENKHRIIAVVLDDNNRWQDIKTMIDWAFSSYEWK